MKTASTTLANHLKQSANVQALPKLLAEWNMNRYYPVFADNTPTEDSSGYDIEFFPIESIYAANRPNKGINKARVGEGKVTTGYDGTKTARFYVGDYDDIYKYWTSPNASDASTAALTNCAPYIIYGTKDTAGNVTYTNVTANKLVIKFENSWATPSTFTVDIRLGGTWTTVFTQANIVDTTWERTGRLALNYNGTNWRQDNPTASTSMVTTLTGVRVTVTALKGGVQEDGTTTTYTTATAPTTPVATTGKDAHLSLIEISARREVDLTADLVSINDSFEISDASNLYPIGTLTANTGSLSLWNGDNTYSNDNPSSPYAGLLEPNVELKLSYVYTLPTGGTESIQQFFMYSDGWDAQRDDVVTVNFSDHSKFFQEIVPRPAMWENLSVPQILFRLCDSVGFNNFKVILHDAATSFVIPVFWVDGEQNLWEILDELAKASQTAIYFAADGSLHCKSREAAMDDTRTPDYTLRGEQSGADLANIISADQTTTYEANSVKVSYSKTRWSDYNNGQPVMQTVWQPEDTTAVRSTQLRRAMTATDSMFYISAADVKYWQYSGKVNIEGEILAYEGLEYEYYTYVGTTATRNVVIVKSSDEQQKYNLKTPTEYQYRNVLTGGIQVATKSGVLQRGIWNTVAAAHAITPQAWQTRTIINGVRRYPANGFTHLPISSKVQLAMSNVADGSMLVSTIGNATDSAFWFYGTKLRLVSVAGQVNQRAGLAIHNDGTSAENGYYIEIKPTNLIDANNRKVRNELMFYTRVGGKFKALASARLAIAGNIDYEIDVAVRLVSGNHQVKIWVNGQLYINYTVTGTNRVAANGRFGMFAIGRTTAQFEYIYALVREEAVDPLDDFSFVDRKTGAFSGKLWNKQWVYRWATTTRIIKKKSTKITYRLNDKFFDEFGPFVHEIREFDVKFDPKPVLHSRPFMTNDWCACLLEYSGNPFGAKFAIANIARVNGILNGDDSLTFAQSGETVSQILAVYGRPLVIDEAESVYAKHDLQIQKRGKVEVELSSPWIQSQSMAQDIANWIAKNMAYGNEELSVTIFGNSLIEITDVVEIFWARKNFTGQKYFVTGIETTWDNGVTTTLTLRRSNPAAV